MQVCTKCRIEKDESEFYTDPRYPEVRHRSVCKECWSKRQKAYRKANKAKLSESNKRYYLENRNKEIARKRQWNIENASRVKELNKQRLDRAHEFVNSMKSPCAKCGETRLHVIQFHHIDHTEKSYEITAAKARRKDTECLIPEINKCVCLCANCHFEFHYFYGAQPQNPTEALNEYLGAEENV